MLGRRPAAASDHAHTVVLNKMLVIFRQLFWRQLVDCVSAFILRQPRVGQDGNILGRVRAQKANCIIHLDRAGCTVETDDVYVEHFKSGQRSANFRPQQHGAAFLKCDLDLDGQSLSTFLHRLKGAYNRDLCLQKILSGFDQKNVDSTLDEREGLLYVGRNHVIEFDVAERRQLGRGANRSRDKAGPSSCGKLLRDFFGNLDRGEIDFRHPVTQAEFTQNDAGAAESVGFYHVAAGGKEVGVDVTNNVGPAQHQHFAAILLAPIVVEGGVARLDVRAHRAVVNDDALENGLEKIRHF